MLFEHIVKQSPKVVGGYVVSRNIDCAVVALYDGGEDDRLQLLKRCVRIGLRTLKFPCEEFVETPGTVYTSTVAV